MSIIDDLRNIVDELQKQYTDFTEFSDPVNITDLDPSSFLSEKVGKSKIFTMEEAIAIFKEQLQTIESALEDESRCIRYVPKTDIESAINLLNQIKIYIDNKNYESFGTRIEDMISPVRSFAMLSMEKMDSKRYSEIKELETVLREIKEHGVSITNIKNAIDEKNEKVDSTYNNIISLQETLIKNIAENNKESRNLYQSQMELREISKHIKTVYDDVKVKQVEFEEFSILVKKRNEEIDSQEAMTKNYEEKLEEYNKEREQLLQKARELITAAEEALKIDSAVGLSAAFAGKEQKMDNIWIKAGWISLGLAASGTAIYLGWDTVQTELGFTTISRTLMMAIAIGVATFAARQYSQNKSIEFDYAYKSALIRSYPGLADEFQKESDNLRADYVAKLLDEMLQDPQRRRDKNNASRFNMNTSNLRKERKASEQAEVPISENK